MYLSLTTKKFSIPHAGIKNCFLVKLRHVTGKCFFIQNRMLCSILFSIVNEEIGKKVHFHHNKDNFCSSFVILTTNFAKNGYFSENKKPLYSHFSDETKSFTQKIQQKKILQEDIPEVIVWQNLCPVLAACPSASFLWPLLLLDPFFLRYVQLYDISTDLLKLIRIFRPKLCPISSSSNNWQRFDIGGLGDQF